ncbi:MAG: SPOR domain-containing protein [Prevotellaceae bacterium]|nr:SPOR domain-containing protein [Prevotellaceae bacterium]
MNELARHIELLLLENDCVILPDLGGLITHHLPAQIAGDTFIPPSRIIAFNRQLKMNDGLLAQSYMTRYATNFVDATQRLTQDITRMLDVLYDTGRVELPAIGALTCDMHDSIDFTPFERTLATPSLFGLDTFTMQPLSAAKPAAAVPTASAPAATHRILAYLPRVAAIVIGFVLLFLFSTPTERYEASTTERADLLPVELFKPVDSVKLAEAEAPAEVPAAKEEVTPTPAPAPAAEAAPAKRYHIVVASVGRAADAREMAEQLVQRGFPEAKAIVGNSRNRVAAFSYATRTEAYNALRRIQENGTFVNAWVLKH